MRPHRRRDGITLAALGCGIATPVLYYGVQLVAAPSFPDFSFLGTTASELGSDRSTRPWIFNTGAILTGLAALVAAVGFLRALGQLGANLILTWLTSFVIVATGLSSLWAGIFPMPDLRHGGHPSLLFAMLSVPFLIAATLWRLSASRAVKAYFVATIVLLLIMVPVMMGVIGLDTHDYRGLLQRVFALTVFVPIGVGAFVLARRINAAPAGPGKPHGAAPAASPVGEEW
jgi:hypothetical membrane protein